MVKTLPISEARSSFKALVDKASRTLARFIITRNGKPGAVLIAHSEYESWQETLEVLASDEELEGIKEGVADLRAGRSMSFEDVFGEPLSGRKTKKRQPLQTCC